MFAKGSNAAERYALNSVNHTATECTGDAGHLRSRAERYRRLAESLHDPKIVTVVLACARELEEYADAMIERQTGPAGFAD